MGKYEKPKKARTAKRKKKGAVLWIAAAAILAVAVAAVFLLKGKPEDLPDGGSVTVQPQTAQTQPETREMYIDLGQRLYVTDIGRYAGLYMEDGTDEMVDNVLMLRLTNHSGKVVEYAEITLSTAAGDAKFSVSTLEPGASAVLLEKNRMQHSDRESYTDVKADFAAFFEEPLDLCSEKLKIQTLDGALNITNISEEDITGPISVYYKNYAEGIYYGGITYRISLEEGLKAGELRQIMAKHLYGNGSRILSVTCEEKGQ